MAIGNSLPFTHGYKDGPCYYGLNINKCKEQLQSASLVWAIVLMLVLFTCAGVHVKAPADPMKYIDG
jgi:hypothetical protein